MPVAEEIERALEDWYGFGDTGGAVAAVGLGDGSVHIAFVGDGAPGEPAQPDDLMRIGSITKTYIAALALRLDDAGLLDIDDPVTVYLADLAIESSVTIRDLMAHMSDIVDPDSEMLIGLILQDPGRRFEVEELLGLTEFPTTAADRTGEFTYANSNYLVLGRVIEAVTGTDIVTTLRREILEPAELMHTHLAGAETIPDPIVPGNVDLDGDGREESLVGIPYLAIESAAWVAGAMVSTPDDLIGFARALFAGQLISDGALAEMTGNDDLEGTGTGAGLGIFDLGIEGRTSYGNSGAAPGFAANFAHDLDGGTTAVVFTNCPSCAAGGNDTWQLLVDLLAIADTEPTG
ncbi:MAG: serine hydrolase domain-containing protein [Ilumatobacteraceae bacterium]